jgi:hypothetical protein
LAFRHGLADMGKTTLSRDHAPTTEALHESCPVWVGDHTSDQVDCALGGFRPRCDGADVQKALGWLRQPYIAVR